MSKRAAIYIRVSSEHQAEKASPDEQEADCRKLAELHGLTLVNTYRDIEKYRVKRRLVEPSATRTDRPALLAMLRDGAAGAFDIILAWKEDRLYRGLRPMLFVLDATQQTHIDILLAKETFDAKMAPIKAWVAGMELESMRERMTMGVKARLRAGKANCGQDGYGYKRNGEIYEIVPEEAKWVKQIFAWYIESVPQLEIRRRLIEADAPQKSSSIPRKIRWALTTLRGIYKQAKVYATGIKIHTRGGEAFEIPVPVLVDPATYEKFLEVREANTQYPAHNTRLDYLFQGLAHCKCNRTLAVRTSYYKHIKGKRIERQPYGYYYCSQQIRELRHPECAHNIGAPRLERIAWAKVCEVLDKPEVLIGAAEKQLEQLDQKAAEGEAEIERLDKELELIFTERQWVITQARKGRISESDMDNQLAGLAIQEAGTKRELSICEQRRDMRLPADWESRVREYLEDLRAGLESLNVPPQNAEEAHSQYLEKRNVVETLVERVDVDQRKEITVTFKLDVLETIKQLQARPQFLSKGEAEICSRRE
jgi:DNA invertase Pin-like site-specific DNA recombinase